MVRMLYTTSVMGDQIRECNVNNAQPLENAFSVNAVKKEEIKDENFVDDEVQTSETAIIADVQDNLIHDQIKQYDISTTLNSIKTEQSLPEIQCVVVQDNLKTEGGITTDNIKIEVDNRLLYCEDCQVYFEDYCVECEMLVHILNKTVLINADNRSREELPNNVLEIHDNFGEYHIFAFKVIPTGVKFGPFTGLHAADHSRKIKGGKFVTNKDESNYLNWMHYINPARNIYERNLCVFQYEHNLYYESTRRIEEGDELLVYFGEEYEDSLNRNVEMDFIPTSEHTFKDAFACTFCCLGFSSKLYLAKHKAICPGNIGRGFTIEELTQCPTCKIYLDQKEYIMHHMAYCSKFTDRKCILLTIGDGTAQVTGRKTRPRQMYKCQQCKYRTKYKGDLKNHANQHYDVKTYKCGVCCRRYKTEEGLRLHVDNTHVSAGGGNDLEDSTVVHLKEHIKTEHSSSQTEMKQLKCPMCYFRTRHRASLKRHVKTKHLTEFKYKCDACDYKAKRKSQLRIHIEARHLKEFKYKCDGCDYKANQMCHLKSHIARKHLKELKYKCDTCDYKTNTNSNLKSHIESIHWKEFKYKCDTCAYKTYWASALKSHTETRHLKTFKYKCDTCDYKANRRQHLQRHMMRRHLMEFKCKYATCDYKTNTKLSLKKHVESRHLKEFMYHCDTCDYKTNTKQNLKSHVKSRHLQEFKYKCDICDYKTNRKSNLKTHADARHLKEFKYKCDSCDYKANQKTHLKRHIETKHLKAFKYKCDTCDYRANQKSQLKRHIETIHLKEFKYKCDTCGIKTNQKHHLKRHIERKHLKEVKYMC